MLLFLDPKIRICYLYIGFVVKYFSSSTDLIHIEVEISVLFHLCLVKTLTVAGINLEFVIVIISISRELFSSYSRFPVVQESLRIKHVLITVEGPKSIRTIKKTALFEGLFKVVVFEKKISIKKEQH